MKHLFAIFLSAALLAGCATQPAANPDENLAAFVNQSKDGRISKEQYTTWNIARMFRLYGGGKGYVSLDDWRRLQGPNRDDIYRSIDKHHTGKVTLEVAEASPRVRALMGGNFASIDTNHDGWIDEKEAEVYLAKRVKYTP